MSNEAEVERLVVRFEGDSKGVENASKKGAKAVDDYAKKVEGKLRDASGRFASAQKMMQNELAKTESKFKQLGIRLKYIAPEIDKIGTKMKSLGRTLSMRVTAPLVALGTASVYAFASFDKAMTESLSIMSATADQAEQMKQVVMDLSSSSIQGPTELAKSYYFLASAGLDAEKSMAALPIVAKFATAGAFDMATATDLLTDAQTALGIEMDANQSNMRLLDDNIVLAAKQANASVQQFAESLTADAGVAARNFGMEVGTTMAVLGAYASAGKKGAEAGNLLGRATRLTTKAYREHGKVFEKYGIEVVNKATGQYNNFIDIIGQMEKAFEGLTKPEIGQALEDLGFEALAQKSILPLIGMTEAMKGWEEAQKKAAGTTEGVYNEQMKAFSNQMKKVWNQLKIVAIGIGEQFVPVLVYLSEKLEAVIEGWSGLSSSTKMITTAFGAVTAVLGPLLMLFGSLAQVIAFGITGLVKYKSVLLALKVAMTTATGAAMALKLVLGGITTVAVAAFFIGVSKALAKVNDEFNKSLSLSSAMQSSWAEGIVTNQNMSGNEKVAILNNKRKQLIQAEENARKEYENQQSWGNTINSVGFGAGYAKDALDAATKQREEFNEQYNSRIARIQQEAQERDRSKYNQASGGLENNKVPGIPANEDMEKAVGRYYDALDKALYKGKAGGASRSKAIDMQYQLNQLQATGAPREQITFLQEQLNIYKMLVLQAERKTKAEKEAEKVAKKQKALEDKGKQLIEQHLTPLEKMEKKVKEIQHLWDVGALQGEAGENTYNRAMTEAVKEYKDSSTKKGTGDAGPLTALKSGSSEYRAELTKYAMGYGPDKSKQSIQKEQLTETRNIVQAVLAGNTKLQGFVANQAEHNIDTANI